MTAPPPEKPADRPGRRGDVLRLLRRSATALSAADLAERLAVHPNTVRFHLDALLADGRVEPALDDRGGPGRPRRLFRAVRGMDPAGPRGYRMLAEALTHGLAAGPDPDARAAEAGRAWGARRAAESGAGEPVDRLVRLLDDLDFAPDHPGNGHRAPIALRHCPFLELAGEGTRVVCAVHLGVMQGALDAWDSGVTVDRLEPFAEPDLCLAHLTAPEETR